MDERRRRFEERYKAGNMPWDIGRPDFNLKEVLQAYNISPGRALDIGCGTGDNAIFLAEKGFDTTGTEIVSMALDAACRKAEERAVRCHFILHDIMQGPVKGAPFDFVFDRGCFHSFDTLDERRRFAKAIADHLSEGGYWLSLVGNADEKRQGPGPPRRSAREIVEAVEPFFEILLLKAGRFDSNMEPPPRNWVMLARRRQTT